MTFHRLFICFLTLAVFPSIANASLFRSKKMQSRCCVRISCVPVTCSSNPDVSSESLEPLTVTEEQRYSVKVPVEKTDKNGNKITVWTEETRSKSVTKTLTTAAEQINFLKRQIGRLENERIPPIETDVRELKTAKQNQP